MCWGLSRHIACLWDTECGFKLLSWTLGAKQPPVGLHILPSGSGTELSIKHCTILEGFLWCHRPQSAV